MGLIRYPIPGGDPARGALGIPPPEVEVDGGLMHVTLRTPAGVSWYGMGESAGPLLRNDASAVLWNTDVPRYGRNEASLYQSIPWVLGVLPDGRAFGVFADTTWRMRIACKDEGGSRLELDAEGDGFDLWLVEGGGPDEVIRGLAGLIGTLPLPPLWALGYHQCRWSYAPAERVREIAREFRARGIPCDAVWLDIDYMDGFRSFTWDAVGFADPGGLMAELGRDGFRAVAILDPGIKAEPGYRVFDEGVAGGHFVRDAGGEVYRGRVWPGLCAFPDFVRAETREWWAGLCAELVRRSGLAGLWIDMNEPSVFRSPTRTMPRSALHAGGTHAEFHNVYGMKMAEATFSGLLEARADARPFVLTRANFAGGQRFAAAWTGDNQSTWQDLRDSIPMVLNLGISGQPFVGPDIGGYEGDPDGELFARWMECASLMPFARGHSRKGNVAKEPWAFGAEVEAACRRALQRRYRLLPYLYTLFHEAERTGMPVVRPVFMADPRDARLREVDDAFLLGDALLVAPVVERGAVARTVVLPHGRWCDFETGEVFEGGTAIRVAAPVGTLPLFARAGSLVPLAPARQHTGEVPGPLELRVFPDADDRARGAVYEDAGDGYGYRAGDFRLTSFAATAEGGAVRVEVVSVAGDRAASSGVEARLAGGTPTG